MSSSKLLITETTQQLILMSQIQQRLQPTNYAAEEQTTGTVLCIMHKIGGLYAMRRNCPEATGGFTEGLLKKPSCLPICLA